MNTSKRWINKFKFAVELLTSAIGVALIALGLVLGETNTLGLILLSAGTSIVAGTIISVLAHWFGADRAAFDELIKKVSKAEQFRDHMNEAGIFEVSDAFDIDTLRDGIKNSKKNVSILDNFIAEDISRVETALVNANARGVSVRVIILNPESESAKQRSLDLGHDTPDYVQGRIKRNIRIFKELQSKHKLNKLEVKAHRSLPSLQILIFDNKAYAGFFFHGHESSAGKHLKIYFFHNEKRTTFGEDINEEFETVWKQEQNITVVASISVIDHDFQPQFITVAEGTTVMWTNNGGHSHTVTAADDSFTSGELKPGRTYDHTYTTAGTFRYHCIKCGSGEYGEVKVVATTWS